MENVRIILSTSLKGGVGKSTVASNVAYQLALLGKRVLICDLDFDVRSLDLILGCEDGVVFDISDVLSGRVPYGKARIQCRSDCSLYFLSAPCKCENTFSNGDLDRLIKDACEYDSLDYIIFDTPGSDGETLKYALHCASESWVIASHTPASLRGAQKSAELCYEHGVTPRLIVNSFDYESVKNSKRSGINDIIDKTSVPLLGVVPYDRHLFFAQERGILASDKDFISQRAFFNIAKRIVADTTGERYIPILKGIKTVRRKRILTR